MRIWLDDVRPPPREHWETRWYNKILIRLGLRRPTWVWCKTYNQAWYHARRGRVARISFDHDLGSGPMVGSGYLLAKDFELWCYLGIMACPKWQVHSANPVGRANIIAAMKNAQRYTEERLELTTSEDVE